MADPKRSNIDPERIENPEPIWERERTVASVIAAELTMDSDDFTLEYPVRPGAAGASFVVKPPNFGMYSGRLYEITVVEITGRKG